MLFEDPLGCGPIAQTSKNIKPQDEKLQRPCCDNTITVFLQLNE